jgi:basic amino acid/polyamine antiporter, APA family
MIMINLGAIIGAGIFVIIGISILRAGPSAILSIILAAAVALLTGLSFSELALHIAKEGGTYEFAKEALTPFAGFMSGWVGTFGSMLAISAVLLSLGGYINSLLGLAVPSIYIAIPALMIFMVINIFGIKHSAKTIRWLVVINILALIIFVMVGIFFFKPSNFAPFTPNGLSGTLAGTAVIFFAFTGFGRVASVAEEVKNPKKNIPKAIVLSIIIATVLYISVAFVALGMLNYRLLGASTSPISAAISIVHNKVLDAIIAIGGIAATAGMAFTGVLGSSRVLFAMGRDDELPKQFSAIDRFSTPINAILLVSFLVIIALLFVNFTSTIELSNAGVLVAYAVVNLAALRMSLRYRKIKRKNVYLSESKYFPLIPILGFLSIMVLLAYLSVSTLYIITAVLVIGLMYYIYKNARKIGWTRTGTDIPVRSAVREFGYSRNSHRNGGN